MVVDDGSESHPAVKKEDAPATEMEGIWSPTPEAPIARVRTTPEGGEEEATATIARGRTTTEGGEEARHRPAPEGGKEEEDPNALHLPAPEGREEDDEVPIAGDFIIPGPEKKDEDALIAGDCGWPTPVKEEGPVAEGGANANPKLESKLEDDKEDAAAVAERWFRCPICLELLYKPVVIGCGHMCCFGCTTGSMHFVKRSNCPICKANYDHLPSICSVLRRLVLKLQPIEGEKPDAKELGQAKKILLDDVCCPICKELLYQPSVLNCGHVGCISCLLPVIGDALKCPLCDAPHPCATVAICWEFNNFLEYYFPAAYKSRQGKIPPASGTPSVGGGTVSHNAKLQHTHVGVGCDSCGVYPIRGERYKCRNCTDGGFDLCGDCFKKKCTVSGLFDQQHTVDHVMDLDESYLFGRLLRLREVRGEQMQEVGAEDNETDDGEDEDDVGDEDSEDGDEDSEDGDEDGDGWRLASD